MTGVGGVGVGGAHKAIIVRVLMLGTVPSACLTHMSRLFQSWGMLWERLGFLYELVFLELLHIFLVPP